MTELANQFKRKRKRLGMTQQEIANKYKVNVTSIRRIEKGEEVGTKLIKLSANFLNVDTRKVLDWMYDYYK